jgi:glycosyltransferase involved in cell wall biosynthesis
MSRILIHSNAPWMPSGYGKQCHHLIRTLRGLGHEVVVSAFAGLQGSPIEWEGITVLPAGMYEFGVDVLLPHIELVKPDLTLLLMDAWKLNPIAEGLKGHNVAAWVAVDCTPLSKLDEAFLKGSSTRAIAMSDHGLRQLKDAGLDPLYAPHVVDRQVFAPLEAEKREKFRAGMGAEGRFVIGIAAANSDATRKGFPEQMEAFRIFHGRHPEAMLWLHTVANSTRGLNLPRLAGELGIPADAIRITDTYPQIAGLFDESLMADWYGVLDVLSACSYAEGFGVPMIEAQACGTPVVATTGSAMTENRGHGWGVIGDEFWNHVHGAWWERPRVDAIVRAYEKAFIQARGRRAEAREFSGTFDVESAGMTWGRILEQLIPAPEPADAPF